MRLVEHLNKERTLLTEAGLSRIVQKVKQENKDFAVITAYRYEFDKQENIKRNRQLRQEFNSRKMGVYQLVGHWQECQLPGVDYSNCPKDQLIDVVERSYLVVRPDEMGYNEFTDLILTLVKRFDQDGALLAKDGDIFLIEKGGKITRKGAEMTVAKMAQAYSQHVKKMNVPFVFEAVVPGTNFGRQLFKDKGLLYPLVEKNEIRVLEE